MDQSKKTMRHFYCRDVLWDTFEQMANDFDCSIDYLINEAMRYYARSKNYTASAGGAPAPDRPAVPPASAHAAAAPAPRSAARQPPPRRGAPPPPPGVRRSPSDTASPARQSAISGSRPLRTPTAEPAAPTSVPTLYLVFNNERIPIDKDQFIIGRGAKTSDLAIKDGNISR